MMMGSIRYVAAAALAAAATPAFADCTCRAGGRNFEVGQTTCIATPDGHRLATCGMVLNNTSWRFSATPCVAAHKDTDAPAPPSAATTGFRAHAGG